MGLLQMSKPYIIQLRSLIVKDYETCISLIPERPIFEPKSLIASNEIKVEILKFSLVATPL